MGTILSSSRALVIALVALSLTLSGCAGMTVHDVLTRHHLLLKLAVQTGTVLVVRDKPQLAPTVVSVAVIVRQTVTVRDPVAPLAAMELLKAELAKMRLGAEERLLILALADAVYQEVHEYMLRQRGDVPAAIRLTVTEVATWIEDAATVYVGRRV